MSATLHDAHVTAWRDGRHTQARHFLARLDPEAAEFTFQVFDDTAAKRRDRARILHGAFDREADRLDELNRDGAGIFVTVAATDGKGRQAHNVERIRAVFVDLDGAPLAAVLAAGLEPHIVVESSPGKYHAYWLTDDCPLDQFERVQRALARRFNGDPSVHDLPRVMRLPGFTHHKAAPQPCRILDGIGTTAPAYFLAEIVRTLALELDAPDDKPPAPVNGDGGKIVPGNRHGHLFALGRSMARRSTPEAVRAALSAENAARCDPPLPDADIDYLASRAFTAKAAQGWQDAPERGTPNADAPDERMHHEPGDNAPARDPDAREGTHDGGLADDGHDWPASLDLEALAERDPHPPRSIMEGLPCGYATGSHGHGGAGKSQIELMRGVCIAADVPFCGLAVERRRVLFISCEDRADILHWRLTRICAHLGVNLASLRGWLEIIDLVGRDSILFAPEPRTGHALTNAYGILSERMKQYKAEVLILDGITDTYGGSENDRGAVKHFVNALLALIPPDTGALILIGHVNKATAGGGDGEGYSGSTAWHNSSRARWYLYPEVIKGEDRAERTGKLIFELQKSNHGEIGAQIEFEWDADAHLFIGHAKSATEFDRRHRDRMEQQGILRALRACATSDPAIIVPATMQGPRTAFHVLSQRPELPDSLRAGKPAVRRFWRQIERLRHIHAIDEASYRRANRHLIAQIVLTAEGVRQCAA